MDSDDVFAAGCLCALLAPALFPIYLLVAVITWLCKCQGKHLP